MQQSFDGYKSIKDMSSTIDELAFFVEKILSGGMLLNDHDLIRLDVLKRLKMSQSVDQNLRWHA